MVIYIVECSLVEDIVSCQSLAPNFTPTELTVLHRLATSVTISWTAMNATDANGYIVYYTTSTESTSAVDVGNVTQYTLGGLVPHRNYTITVRAYQDLLGPASVPLEVATSRSKLMIAKINIVLIRTHHQQSFIDYSSHPIPHLDTGVRAH